jgi:hypothetical protein
MNPIKTIYVEFTGPKHTVSRAAGLALASPIGMRSDESRPAE